jgi:hypothetical protein
VHARGGVFVEVLALNQHLSRRRATGDPRWHDPDRDDDCPPVTECIEPCFREVRAAACLGPLCSARASTAAAQPPHALHPPDALHQPLPPLHCRIPPQECIAAADLVLAFLAATLPRCHRDVHLLAAGERAKAFLGDVKPAVARSGLRIADVRAAAHASKWNPAAADGLGRWAGLDDDARREMRALAALTHGGFAAQARGLPALRRALRDAQMRELQAAGDAVLQRARQSQRDVESKAATDAVDRDRDRQAVIASLRRGEAGCGPGPERLAVQHQQSHRAAKARARARLGAATRDAYAAFCAHRDATPASWPPLPPGRGEPAGPEGWHSLMLTALDLASAAAAAAAEARAALGRAADAAARAERARLEEARAAAASDGAPRPLLEVIGADAAQQLCAAARRDLARAAAAADDASTLGERATQLLADPRHPAPASEDAAAIAAAQQLADDAAQRARSRAADAAGAAGGAAADQVRAVSAACLAGGGEGGHPGSTRRLVWCAADAPPTLLTALLHPIPCRPLSPSLPPAAQAYLEALWGGLELARHGRAAAAAEAAASAAARRLVLCASDAACAAAHAAGAAPGSAAPGPATRGGGAALAGRLASARSRAPRLRFRLAPTSGHTVEHVHIHSTCAASLVGDMLKHLEGRVPKRFQWRENQGGSTAAASAAAWRHLLRRGVCDGSFAGHISTDGVTACIAVHRRTREARKERGKPKKRADATKEARERAAADARARVARAVAPGRRAAGLDVTDAAAWGWLRQAGAGVGDGPTGVRLVAIDFGARNFMTAVTSDATWSGAAAADDQPASAGAGLKARMHRESTKGWRDAAGMGKAQRVRAAAQRRADPRGELAAAVSSVPAAAALGSAEFEARTAAFLAAHEAAGRRLYGTVLHRQKKLHVHCASEREMHRTARELCGDARRVRGRWSRGAARRDPAAGAAAPPALTVVGYGADFVRPGSPISRPGGGPPIRRFLKFCAANYSQQIALVELDEFRTSKICTGCWRLDNKGPFTQTTAPVDSYQLLACNGAPHHKPLVVQRDASAALALMARLLQVLFPDADARRIGPMERASGAN